MYIIILNSEGFFMNLLITLNSNYIFPLCVMLHSLALSNASNHFDIYVVYSSLTEDDFKMMERALGSADAVIHRVTVDEKIFDSAPVLSRISKETYYRLLISELIPDDVHRILYIDPDTVVIRDLSKLYNLDLKGNVLAAGTHMKGIVRKFNVNRLGLKKDSNYFNAGVMLIDVDKWKEYAPAEKILKFISDNIKKLKLGDQDVVNMMFEDKILLFDERYYNLDEKIFFAKSFRIYTSQPINREWVRNNTVIVHYNGSYKPWKTKKYFGRLGEYFEKYRNF